MIQLGMILCWGAVCLLFFAATTLTGLHFVMTTLMTVGLRFMGYIQPSHLPFLDLAKFALCANFSIVGMNVSLMWNSVGFYQVKYCNCLLLCLAMLFSLIAWHSPIEPQLCLPARLTMIDSKGFISLLLHCLLGFIFPCYCIALISTNLFLVLSLWWWSLC